jgi:hypothetical protein
MQPTRYPSAAPQNSGHNSAHTTHTEYSIAPAATWHEAWRLRPLLPLSAVVATGCAVGLGQPTLFEATLDTVSVPLLVLQLAAALLLSGALWFWKRQPASNIGLFTLLCALCATFALLAAQRSTPPQNDISQQVRSQSAASRMAPQRRVDVTLSGWIADHPQRGDFGIEFPLQCDHVTSTRNGAPAEGRVAQGRVWMRLPVEAESATPLQVGDAITARAQLADLPRIGNPGERSRQARYILESCWSIARVRKAEDVRVVQRDVRYPLQRRIAELRQRLMTHYETALAGPGSTTPSLATTGNTSSNAARPYAHATAQLLVAMFLVKAVCNNRCRA